jgi:hypothetical protein
MLVLGQLPKNNNYRVVYWEDLIAQWIFKVLSKKNFNNYNKENKYCLKLTVLHFYRKKGLNATQ